MPERTEENPTHYEDWHKFVNACTSEAIRPICEVCCGRGYVEEMTCYEDTELVSCYMCNGEGVL